MIGDKWYPFHSIEKLVKNVLDTPVVDGTGLKMTLEKQVAHSTKADRDLFRDSGVRFLITTTPVMEDRTFGRNMIEAALVAASGEKKAIDYGNPGSYFQWMENLIEQLGLSPQMVEL